MKTTNQSMRTYHIYLEDKCLFKDLNQEEFDVIWGRIYKSYFKEELTYTSIDELEKDHILSESSYSQTVSYPHLKLPTNREY